jgi:4-amino-4-deoxy-L-arabinose transferase-like glycosyltransferase
MHGSPWAGELESADFAVQARQRPVLKRYTGMAAPPHPYPWATWAPRRRRHHRVGLESGLNQDNRSTQYLRRVVLAAILALGAAIRCWRLDAGGFIVPYYFAGVRSMMGSWHNFFYNAFDPAGFVSLDKPPVAFWLQTASAKLLGFGTVSVLLPQILAGLASIFVLYALVRRRFGTSAGLLATLFLALNPINVAVDRSNSTESWLVLTLLLAVGALSRAVETGRARFLLLAAALVGIAFNVKMLVALGVVPAFALVWLIGAATTFRRRFGQLVQAGAVLCAASFTWSLVYDLTPAQRRPFVDSTSGNSMFELIVGENFIKRFVPRGDRVRQTAATSANPTTSIDRTTPPELGRDYVPAGPLRLAMAPLAAQIGWLLPVALIGGFAAWRRYRGSLGHERLMLLLWAGWGLIYSIVFSAAAGLFHAYYLAVMAPALCALAGIGADSLWVLYRSGRASALWFPATILLTGIWQVHILEGYIGGTLAIEQDWLTPALFGTTAALALGLAIVGWRQHGPGLPFAAAALSVLPAMPVAWSIGSTLTLGNAGFPVARPPFPTAETQARRGRWVQLAGAIAGDPKLIAFLEHHHGREDYLLAVVSARQAAPIIIATGKPVMALGGFSGGDPILTVDDFARLVAEHRVRFALIGDGSERNRQVFGEGRQKPLIDWIQANGKSVDAERWLTPITAADPRTASDRALRAAESVGARLYDVRPADDDGG